MTYRVIEEASEAQVFSTDNFIEAVNEIERVLPQTGKYLVLDSEDQVLYDSKPGISYKI